MLTDLLAIINRSEFEDSVIVSLSSVTWADNTLRLRIAVGLQDTPPLMPWDIVCVEPRVHQVTLGAQASLTLTHDHVLLWPHNRRQTSVSFNGGSEDPLSVIGALYERHVELVGSWFPFRHFINRLVPLHRLLAGPGGKFAEGPEPLMAAYEAVLNTLGIQASHLTPWRPKFWDGGRWVEEDGELKLLLLEPSYVVAKDVQAFEAVV